MRRTIIVVLFTLLLATCGNEPTGGDYVLQPGGDSGPGGPVLSAREQTLVEALSEAMIQCPDRVWPGGSWQTFQVMFVDRDAQRAVLWNDLSQGYGSEPRITLVPYDDLTTDFLFGYYNFTTWNTEMTLSISLDLTGIWAGTDLALSLAFHEGFHYFNQRTWTGGGGQRDDDYPIDWQPRYLRFRLISALRDALVNQTDLGAAAHWRQQWITGYAAEVAQIRGTDRIEGSANYAEMIALRIAEHGCSITETALDNEIRNGIDTMIMASLDKSGESYDLGVAAGALMRANQITDWQGRVELGETPTEILLATEAVVAQPVDTGAETNVQSTIDQQNQTLAALLDPFVAMLSAAGSHRLALPIAWLGGSFSTSGGYYLTGVTGSPHVFVSTTASFVTPTSQTITFTNLNVLDVNSTLCSSVYSFVAAFPATAFTDNGDGTADIVTPGMSLTGLAMTTTIDLDGVTWICPQ